LTAGVLVVGEALIDEVVEAGHPRRHAGGSPANVALGLARLNIATRLHTAIGSDEDGAFIRDHLGRSGVIVTAESTTDAPTSKAVATLSEDKAATYEFALSWAPVNLIDLGAPKAIHTGSLAAFLEPGCDVTKDIVDRGRTLGSLVTFDPNIRPSLVGDSGKALKAFESIAFASHITKLSDDDAEFLFPGKSPSYVLDRLIAGGVSVAAITKGGEGALLASGAERVVILPVEVTVADTVGAGDSFMAALIWSLIAAGGGWDGHPISRQRLTDIGGMAALAAAITVSRPGADPPRLIELVTHQFAG
jgi:fructokinase